MTINARKQSNYGRTSPTCKFCGTQGHTLTKCPDMIALYEEVKDKPIHERDFKGNYAVQYIERKKGISKTGTKVAKKPKKCVAFGPCKKEKLCGGSEGNKESDPDVLVATPGGPLN